MRKTASLDSTALIDPVQELDNTFERPTLPGMECQAGPPAGSHVARFVELRRTVPSQVSLISGFSDELMQFLMPLIAESCNAQERGLDIETALQEALANAVIHGNREDPQKQVYVILRYSLDGTVTIAVADEGRGFDAGAVVDPTQGERRFLNHGRGISMMRAFMDEVCFEQKGKVVRMRKKLSI